MSAARVLQDRAAALWSGRRVVAELVHEATDPTAVLAMSDRLSLATLALAVEVEVSRRAGVASQDAELRSTLATALTALERRSVVRLA